jgi:hypothetical protein
VTAHGLKGTNKTLSTRKGKALELVSLDAGHTSTRVTVEHYIAPGTIENVNNARVHDVLRSEPLGKIGDETFPKRKTEDPQVGNPQPFRGAVGDRTPDL